MIGEKEIAARLEATRAALAGLAARPAAIARAISMVIDTYRSGGKVLLFGNGGSAAEASHLAAEFVNRMRIDRAPLSAIALATDSSVVTSIANDYSFTQLFSKQVEAHGRAGDLCWGFSTSGKSENVLLAFRRARELGLRSLGMAGKSGSAMDAACDLCLCVESDLTAVIQEAHLCMGHIICDAVEQELFGGGRG